jgi:hypothetical protein
MTRLASALVIGALLAAAPPPAFAQQSVPITVSAGSTLFREQPPGNFDATTYDPGWSISASYPVLLRRLSAVVDIGRNTHVNIVEEKQEVFSILAGARYAFVDSPRLTVFAQAVVGRERFTEPGLEETATAFQPGGGVDVYVWRGLGVRAEADYRFSRYGDATFKDVRAVAGIVVGFRR